VDYNVEWYQSIIAIPTIPIRAAIPNGEHCTEVAADADCEVVAFAPVVLPFVLAEVDPFEAVVNPFDPVVVGTE